MARVTGLEPAASGVTGRRSNQLSYTRASDGSAAVGVPLTTQVTLPCQRRFSMKIKLPVKTFRTWRQAT
jgi:hypothetical protein